MLKYILLTSIRPGTTRIKYATLDINPPPKPSIGIQMLIANQGHLLFIVQSFADSIRLPSFSQTQ